MTTIHIHNNTPEPEEHDPLPEIAFDRDIPPPPIRPERRMKRWPFRDMKPGDSILVIGAGEGLYTVVGDARKRGPHDFVTRREGENGLRVWCIDKADRPKAPPVTIIITN